MSDEGRQALTRRAPARRAPPGTATAVGQGCDTDFKYASDAAVNGAGVPKTDHCLVRLELGFKFMPRRLRAVKTRIDRTLLNDPVVKLKFQSSVVDFIDAAQTGQYAALTTQLPSMPVEPCAFAAAAWSSGY